MTEDTTITSTSVVVVVRANQEAIQVLKGMVIEKRVPNLLSLIESHAGEAAPEISVVSRPPTPTPTPTPAPSPRIDPVDNKRKRENKARNGVIEEGDIQEETPQGKLGVQRPVECSRGRLGRLPRPSLNVSLGFHSGILLWFWMGLLFPHIPLSEILTMEGRVTWPMPWNKRFCCLRIWQCFKT